MHDLTKPTAGRSSGASWRWNLGGHAAAPRTIAVIEPPKGERKTEPANAKRVPFGFGVREPEWYGNPS